jgi:hypothetical protein
LNIEEKYMAYFRNLVSDPLFIRVCIAIFSLLVSCLFGLPIFLNVFVGSYWDVIGFLFCLIFTLGGIYVFLVAVFGSDARLEKLMDYFDFSSADILGLLFLGLVLILVGVVAIPITMSIRYFMPRNMALDFLKSQRRKNDEQP